MTQTLCDCCGSIITGRHFHIEGDETLLRTERSSLKFDKPDVCRNCWDKLMVFFRGIPHKS